MRVAAPEHRSAQQSPPRQGVPAWLVGVGLAALALYLFAGWVGGILPDFANPFQEETVDRSGPALLKSLQDLEEYRAASGHFEVIVDLERDTRFVPSAIRGERVLFVAVGSVDAGVSFAGLDEDAVDVSADRSAATILLPPAEYHEPQLDLERSYVHDRDRGAIDRLGSLFGDETGDDRELYRVAERRLAQAARDGSGLLARAEQNTRAMLTSLLRSLGVERVEIRFAAV
jgi:Protein of unknown function (DUF4230)